MAGAKCPNLGGSGSNPARARWVRKRLRALSPIGLRSPHAAFPPAPPCFPGHAGLSKASPAHEHPPQAGTRGATLTSETRRRLLQRETAAGERRARPAARGPRRVAELSCAAAEGRPLLSDGGAAAGPPPSRPLPPKLRPPASASGVPPSRPASPLSPPGVIGPLPEMNAKRRGEPSTKMSCDILLMGIIYSKSSLD